MEIGHQTLARNAHRVDVVFKLVVVDNIVLWKDMDDFLARVEHYAVLLFDKTVYIGLFDESLVFGNHHAALIRAAFDVLTGNAHINLFHVVIGHFGGVAYRTTDGIGCVVDVAHYAVLHTHGLRFAESFNLDFAVFGAQTDETGDFCCSDVKTYNVFTTHGIYFLLFIFSVNDILNV